MAYLTRYTHSYLRVRCAGTQGSVYDIPFGRRSISAISSRSPSLLPKLVCVICQDETDDSITRLSCGHFLDASCLRTMFDNAAKDESLYPPKCCQTVIELDSAREYLNAPLIELYQRKAREFDTKDRVYCHISTCSTFLGGATAAPEALRCSECRAETCGSCKHAAHHGRTCDARLEDAMLEFAKEQGWQRCPTCKYLVGRTEGCNRMLCRCNHTFCYLCGAAWKTCSCPYSGPPPAGGVPVVVA